MENSIKVHLSKAKEKDMEYILILTKMFIQGFGKTINVTEKAI